MRKFLIVTLVNFLILCGCKASPKPYTPAPGAKTKAAQAWNGKYLNFEVTVAEIQAALNAANYQCDEVKVWTLAEGIPSAKTLNNNRLNIYTKLQELDLPETKAMLIQEINSSVEKLQKVIQDRTDAIEINLFAAQSHLNLASSIDPSLHTVSDLAALLSNYVDAARYYQRGLNEDYARIAESQQRAVADITTATSVKDAKLDSQKFAKDFEEYVYVDGEDYIQIRDLLAKTIPQDLDKWVKEFQRDNNEEGAREADRILRGLAAANEKADSAAALYDSTRDRLNSIVSGTVIRMLYIRYTQWG